LGVLRQLAPRDLAAGVPLYEDDVVPFCHPDRSELLVMRELLASFGHTLGLHTNFAKCSVSPIGCSEEVAEEATSLMECQLADLPIRSLRRLSTAALQPVVDRIADCLPKWKAGMAAKVGHLALVKSVHAAIPLHQLVILGVNVRALKQVEKILRGFFWTGRKEAHGGHCHVN
jgi:hypothetical protein